MEDINLILEQLRNSNSTKKNSAVQGVELTEPAPGQLHISKEQIASPESVEIHDFFFLVIKVSEKSCNVIPGSWDGIMAGPQDIVLPQDVLGQYVYLSPDMQTTVPREALANGFAILDNKTYQRVLVSLTKTSGNGKGKEESPRPFSGAMPYISDFDDRIEYHKTQRKLLKKLRQKKQIQKILFQRLIEFKHWGKVACFLLISALIFAVLDWNSTDDTFSYGPDTPDKSLVIIPDAPDVAKRNENALAYLADIQGEVKISSAGGSGRSLTCFDFLACDDVVTLSSGASAKIVYSDAIFEVTGPQKYQIQNLNPKLFSSEQIKGEAIQPTVTTRKKQRSTIVTSPRALLVASITPPVTRAGESINVYSPNGASFTDQPVIKIGGDPQKTYEVSILDMDNSPIGNPIEVPGGTQRSWSDFSSTPIEADKIYNLQVRLNGKIINDVNNSSFWLSEDKEHISELLNYVSSIKSVQEKNFFQACILYEKACYAEAFLILENTEDSENHLIKQLRELCKISLKIQEK